MYQGVRGQSRGGAEAVGDGTEEDRVRLEGSDVRSAEAAGLRDGKAAGSADQQCLGLGHQQVWQGVEFGGGILGGGGGRPRQCGDAAAVTI